MPTGSPGKPINPRSPSKAELLALAVASGEALLFAAKRLGIGVRTAKRWNADPEFRARVAALRAEHIERTLSRLSVSSAAAAAELARLMTQSTSETVRLAASKAILDRLPTLAEYFEYSERVRALERKAARAKRGRR